MNKRRKGALSVIMPWLKRFGLLTGIAVIGGWICAWLWISGGFAQASEYTRDEIVIATAAMGFKIENVQVEGRTHSDAKALKSIVDTHKGAPLFSFDPAAAQEKIEKMEWVKHAVVERRLPDTVYIRIEEHTPLALWQQGDALKLLNDEGAVVNTDRLGRFRDLIIVMGADAPARAPELLANLGAEPGLAPYVTSAKWMDGRRWDLILKGGITVKLPETDMELALRRLAQAETDDKILQKDITGVDLREPGRIAIRTRPGAIKEYKEEAGDNI